MSHLLRSLKITGTNMDQSPIYDFLLVIHSNHGPISYHFPHKWRSLSKITKFSHPPVWVMPLTEDAKSLTICTFISIQYQHVTDRQTDRQTERFAIISCSVCRGRLTHDKNCFQQPLWYRSQVSHTEVLSEMNNLNAATLDQIFKH